MNAQPSRHRIGALTEPTIANQLPGSRPNKQFGYSQYSQFKYFRMEELEARHKKEKRELEGAARAARKGAGKSKSKQKEADAAAEQALKQLIAVHVCEMNVLTLKIRDGDGDGDVNLVAQEGGGDAQQEERSRADIAGIKEILTAQRVSEVPVVAELRIDPSDGQGYTFESFLEEYGEADGKRRWETAVPSDSRSASIIGDKTPYIVMGSKKGGFPVSVESRARGKKVTVIHNVSGNVEALLTELKRSVGAGGIVRDGDVEVQGDHSTKVEAMLIKLGCIKGVSRANIAAALPPTTKTKSGGGKSIARLDKKATLQSSRK